MAAPTVIRWIAFAIAGAALVWAAAVLPVFATSYPLDPAARRIAVGEAFAADSLGMLAALSTASRRSWIRCGDTLPQDRVLVAIASMDGALTQGNSDAFEGMRSELADASRDLLTCSPRAALGWFALYWGEVHRAGLDPDAIAWLRRSYELAPREAWLGLRRNRMVMQVLPWLPKDLQSGALAEFEMLVRAGQTAASAETFISLRREDRKRLLERLAALPQGDRASFAAAVSAIDSSVDLGVLQLPARPERPWD